MTLVMLIILVQLLYKNMTNFGGKILPEFVKGKFLKKKINGVMKNKWEFNKKTIVDSAALDLPKLKEVSNKIKNWGLDA